MARAGSPDALGKKHTGTIALTVGKLDRRTVLTECDSHSLEYLGELVLAISRPTSSGSQISPREAGRALSSPASSLGIRIHRCDVYRLPKDRFGQGRASAKTDRPLRSRPSAPRRGLAGGGRRVSFGSHRRTV